MRKHKRERGALTASTQLRLTFRKDGSQRQGPWCKDLAPCLSDAPKLFSTSHSSQVVVNIW